MPGDIFDNAILCNKCGKRMKQVLISKNGFNLRALKCEKCNEHLIHPEDKREYEEFIRLKQKEFNVKMRMVGNSYAVSIPREIVDFMHEQEKRMNNMVRMCFEDAGRISLMFGNQEGNEPNNNPNIKSRTVSSKEVHVVKDGKPVLHAKQFYDSAHPERNKNIILKAKKEKAEELKEEEEEVEL